MDHNADINVQEVGTDLAVFRPHCCCGWRGNNWMFTYDGAETLAREHESENRTPPHAPHPPYFREIDAGHLWLAECPECLALVGEGQEVAHTAWHTNH